MSPSPLHVLLLETIVLSVFLGMTLWTQLERAADPMERIRRPGAQFRIFLLLFGVFTAGLTAILYNASPLLGAALGAGFALSLLHPVNALCFFVQLLFLRPWEIMPDNRVLLALPRVLAATCALSWLIHPDKRARPGQGAGQALVLLGAFGAWSFITTFVTPDPSSAQAGWFDSFFKAIVVFVMCLFFIKTERDVSAFKRTIVISVMGTVVVSLVEFFLNPPPAGTDAVVRLQSVPPVLDPNDLAAVTIMTLPFVLRAAFRRTAGLGRRLAGAFLAGASLMAVWYSQSRGALVALLAQVLGARYLKDIRKNWLGALLLACVLAAGYFGALQVIRRNQEEMGASAESRIIYWKAGLSMAAHHPLLGVGYGEYPRNYEAYSSGQKYEWGRRTAHSTWILALAEAGFPGGLLFIAFFVAVWKAAWRTREEHPDHLNALVGYGVAISFLSHTYVLYPYLLAGMVLAADSVKRRSHGS
jgi:hypothetical protein